MTDTAPSPTSPTTAPLTAVRDEIGKAVVGNDTAVLFLILALLCEGHVLLEGVPGVAKTLLVRSLATALDVACARVQFTPDLMPGDVTGSQIYDPHTGEFTFREGPVFTSLLLADEINRTPPKTQAALLEAMEERQVSVDGQPRPLPDPFVVVATQNPLEHEGTYPLPEAQLDRFLFKVDVALPERDQEYRIALLHLNGFDPRNLATAGIKAVANAADIIAARKAVAGQTVAPTVVAYAVDLVRATRTSSALAAGASPRGTLTLVKAARAFAWLNGRTYCTPDDIKAVAIAVLRHRVIVAPEAELDGATAEAVLDTILRAVPAPV